MNDFPLPFAVTPQSADLPEGFLWGRHHRGYLAHCSRTCALPLPQLAEKFGYKKLEKFQRLRAGWDQADGQVPIKYLEAIRVDMNLLGTCVDMDLREYEAVLAMPRFPKTFTDRVLPAVYLRVPLPDGISEGEAIQVVVQHAMATGRSCLLSQVPIVRYWINPKGRVDRETFKPELRVKDRQVIFGGCDALAGVMRTG